MPENMDTARRRRGPTFWGLILCGLVVVAVVLFYTGPSLILSAREIGPASSTLSEFSTALVRNDFGRAYELTTEEFREAMSLEAFADQQKRLEGQYGRLISAKQGGTEITIRPSESEWRGVATMRFHFERRDIEFTYVLHHVGGHWAVYGYKEGS